MLHAGIIYCDFNSNSKYRTTDSYKPETVQYSGELAIIHRFVLTFNHQQNLEKYAIHSLLAIGTICCLLLANYWNVISDVAGRPHSVTFFVLAGFLALVDCTSSVLYFPFLSHFKPIYMRSLLIGEGFSGLIPSLVALIQGVGGNPICVEEKYENGTSSIHAHYNAPLFSVETFFYFLTGLMFLSWIAFHLLNTLDVVKDEMVQVALNVSRSSEELLPSNQISKRNFIGLLLLQCYCCCLMNGILAAIQTYSTLPYGNTTYHMTTTLTVISGPTAVFLVFFFQNADSFQKPILPLAGVGSICAGYILFLATSSPSPPLQTSTFGSTLVVMTWVLFHGSFSYVKACIAGSLRNCSYSKQALFNYGAFTQIGSLTGAIIIFTIMNTTKTFVSYNPCSSH